LQENDADDNPSPRALAPLFTVLVRWYKQSSQEIPF